MPEPLGVGVIGAGRPNIATSCHLPALRQVSALRLVALHDTDEEGVRRYAAEHGVAAYTDLGAMLARDDLDVVHVCSPDPWHAQQTIAALEAGKHVLCEKPMALNAADAECMVATARRVGRKLTVCQNLRWQPRYRRLRELIAAGRVGEPVYGAFTLKGRHFPYPSDSFYRTAASGGQFVHNGPHYVDLLCWLLDSLPERVFVRTKRHFPGGRGRPGDDDRLETDNYVSALMRTDKGAIASVEMNLMMLDPPGLVAEQSVLIVGTRGTLRSSSRLGGVEVFGSSRARRVETNAGTAVEAFAALMTDFAEAIREDREPAVSPEWASRVLQTCLQGAAVSDQRTTLLPSADR